MNGFGLPTDLNNDFSAMKPETKIYIALLAHEFWHATMQIGGTANNPEMEREAFVVQREVMKELGIGEGEFPVQYIQGIIDNPASYGYNWDLRNGVQTCVGIGLTLSPLWGDYAALNRRTEAANTLETYGK